METAQILPCGDIRRLGREHPDFGAFHSSDLIYGFNNLQRMKRPWTETDRKVADQASSYWVNFVKTGNPNGENLPKWEHSQPSKPASPESFAPLMLGARMIPFPAIDKSRWDFYLELLSK